MVGIIMSSRIRQGLTEAARSRLPIRSLRRGLLAVANPACTEAQGQRLACNVTMPGKREYLATLRDGYLQTLPGLLPCDGFFAAILTRS